MPKPQIALRFVNAANQRAPGVMHASMRAFHYPVPCLEPGLLPECFGFSPTYTGKRHLAYTSSPLWSRLTTASMTCLNASAFSRPTSASMRSWFAVNNLPGRA
jgi:hypothetical protein